MSTTTTSTTDQLIREFAGSGDSFLLGVIADSLDDAGRLPALAGDCRACEDASSVRFFLGNSNHTFGAGSAEEQKLRAAFQLSRAENWYNRNEAIKGYTAERGQYRLEWFPDYDHYDEFSPSDRDLWECYLSVFTARGWVAVQSQHGIDLGKGTPRSSSYARAVEAELCLEEME